MLLEIVLLTPWLVVLLVRIFIGYDQWKYGRHVRLCRETIPGYAERMDATVVKTVVSPGGRPVIIEISHEGTVHRS
jgi:hypothetical protein